MKPAPTWMSAGRVAVGIAWPSSEDADPSNRAAGSAPRIRDNDRKLLDMDEFSMACKVAFLRYLDANPLLCAELESVCYAGCENEGSEAGLERPALIFHVHRSDRQMPAGQVLNTTPTGKQEVGLIGHLGIDPG